MDYVLPPDDSIKKSRHAAVGAWFFGPRAENFSYLERTFKYILEKQKDARQNLFPKDQDFITEDMKQSGLYKAQIAILESELGAITDELSKHSVPFWSPRYNGHMSMENSMPAVIGYLTGLLYNQNNVATEASPLTTLLEYEVGQQLCRMLGFNTNNKITSSAWGHITCGGSVANLESIWAARNLKFYPLSLSLAISEGNLGFLGGYGSSSTPRFEIELCSGQKKPFMDCSTWELLNLKPSTVLDIPDRLANEYGISQTALGAALKDYSIQTLGKDKLEEKFGVKKPAQFFVGATKHYSWPKGAAIAGIGSAQILDVPVDLRARMIPEELESMLEKALQSKQAVYAVVAIIGSTEHGAVDPLDSILKLRKKYEERGLSFVVHCDGAWGGYFASLLRSSQNDQTPKGQASYVPTLALSPYTITQLDALKDADSITIDPHKSGYCPYPAGGLCYRDGRMRYLVTWTSPVIFREADANKGESIGVYGVEGSKPGAAAVGTYLSHEVLGLHKDGYGTLLGEAIYSCARLYCHWAAMKTEPIKSEHGFEARLIVRPLNMLPSESENKSPEEIEKERQFIRDHILNRDNVDLEKDKKAIELLQKLGGDLMINAFACNFEINGKLNEDIVEANNLNARIFQQLSVSDKYKNITDIPLIITSTSLAQSAYKGCLTNFKNRLGLKGEQDLYILINVTMSPWPTTQNFLGRLAESFRAVAEKQMLLTAMRNVEFPHFHGFIMQGVDQVCGVHLPMFNMENHRTQLVIACDFSPEIMEEYRKRKAANPGQFFTFGNKNPAKLLDLIKDGASFEATVQEGFPWDNKPISSSTTVGKVKILLQRSMHARDLRPSYPTNMVFYAYGRGNELHMDHLLNTSPNIQLNTERMKVFDLEPPSYTSDVIRKKGLWLRLVNVYESAIQPILMPAGAAHTSLDNPGLPFKPGSSFSFAGYESENEALDSTSDPLVTGRLEIGPSVFADCEMLNADGAAEHDSEAVRLTESDTSAGAMAAEYPNADSSDELHRLYQENVMQSFNNSWNESRQEQIQSKVDEYEGKSSLKWLVDRKKKVAEEGGYTRRPVRLYHSGMH